MTNYEERYPHQPEIDDGMLRNSVRSNGTIDVYVVGLDSRDIYFQTINLKTGRIRELKLSETQLKNKYPLEAHRDMGVLKWT